MKKNASANNQQPPEIAPERLINITGLSENELLNTLQTYADKMAHFANTYKNVHRELKEYTANTNMVLNQCASVSHKGTTPPTPEPIESIRSELAAR